jgi:hypothetical protein
MFACINSHFVVVVSFFFSFFFYTALLWCKWIVEKEWKKKNPIRSFDLVNLNVKDSVIHFNLLVLIYIKEQQTLSACCWVGGWGGGRPIYSVELALIEEEKRITECAPMRRCHNLSWSRRPPAATVVGRGVPVSTKEKRVLLLLLRWYKDAFVTLQ